MPDQSDKLKFELLYTDAFVLTDKHQEAYIVPTLELPAWHKAAKKHGEDEVHVLGLDAAESPLVDELRVWQRKTFHEWTLKPLICELRLLRNVWLIRRLDSGYHPTQWISAQKLEHEAYEQGMIFYQDAPDILEAFELPEYLDSCPRCGICATLNSGLMVRRVEYMVQQKRFDRQLPHQFREDQLTPVNYLVSCPRCEAQNIELSELHLPTRLAPYLQPRPAVAIADDLPLLTQDPDTDYVDPSEIESLDQWSEAESASTPQPVLNEEVRTSLWVYVLNGEQDDMLRAQAQEMDMPDLPDLQCTLAQPPALREHFLTLFRAEAANHALVLTESKHKAAEAAPLAIVPPVYKLVTDLLWRDKRGLVNRINEIMVDWFDHRSEETIYSLFFTPAELLEILRDLIPDSLR